MPVGELAALSSALIFSLTAIVDKLMTRRHRPLSLGAMSTLGGATFAVVLLFATGRASDLPNIPIWAIGLSVAGSVLAVGIGMPLYLKFLTSVDISKVSPLTSGIQTLLAVMIGLVLLSEDSSPTKLIGIAVIVSGVYALSFSQRRQVEASQAQWLGPRGIVFLAFIVSLWVGGTAIQKIAVDETGPIIANAVRLVPVFFILSILASSNWAFVLGSETRIPARLRRGAASRRRRSASGQPAQQYLGPLSHLARMPHWPRHRTPRHEELRRIPVRIKPPVFWDQLDRLGDSLQRVGGALQQMERSGARGGLLYYIELPGSYAPEATLTAMPEVAVARWTGHWPGTHRIEIALHPPSSLDVIGLGDRHTVSGAIASRIRVLKLDEGPYLQLLIPVINGSFSMGVASLLMLVALDRVGLALTAVLSSTQLLWITLLSALVLRERLNWKTFFGVGATTTGVVIVVL